MEGDFSMESWEIIQACALPAGLYDKNQFIEIIEQLSPQQFYRFCRSLLHLQEFYDTNQTAWVTDQKELIESHASDFWQLKEIDFDKPVNFIRIK